MKEVVPSRTKALAIATIFAFVAFPAWAQTTPQTPSVDSVPEKAAPGTGIKPDPNVTPEPKTTDQPKTLSDKLNQSNGVIHPKEVDPSIEKPAPSTGTDGVIPPPGTPGGAPAPQAK